MNYMPSLFKVCVKNTPPDYNTVYTIGSPNVYYSTDCN
jgi:hypothetical protein